MFALAALICFVLQLFHAHLGALDLVVAGLCFVALHLLVGDLGLPASLRRNRS